MHFGCQFGTVIQRRDSVVNSGDKYIVWQAAGFKFERLAGEPHGNVHWSRDGKFILIIVWSGAVSFCYNFSPRNPIYFSPIPHLSRHHLTKSTDLPITLSAQTYRINR